MNYKITLVLFFFSFVSCSDVNNDKVDTLFENEFRDCIEKSKAVKFDFLQDGLVPQENYFIGNKLKFLKYRYNPELGFSERRVYFNLETDSIENFTLRIVVPEWETIKGNNEDDFKFNDTIFEVFPKLKDIIVYFNNEKVDTLKTLDDFNKEIETIYKIKTQTEKAYIKKALN